MLKWVQGGVSALTGSAEPEYGAEAFESVSKSVEGKNPVGTLSLPELNWLKPAGSNVETQTFYFFCKDSKRFGHAQIIHSNPLGIQNTAQFTFRVCNPDKPEEDIWSSTNVEEFEPVGPNFTAKGPQEGVSIKLIPSVDDAGNTTEAFHIKIHVSDEVKIDLIFTRTVEGFKIGPTGKSKYGEDLANPWGSMRHSFWPRASVSGTIDLLKTEKRETPETLSLDNDFGFFVHATQGMKPHHAASKWNFITFQSENYSAVVMDYTTPPSYGGSRVTIGGVANKDKLLFTSATAKVEHTETETDEEVGWDVPTTIRFEVDGPKIETKDEDIEKPEERGSAVIEGPLTRMERVDVMAEIPAFLKSLATTVSGTKPYIYQFLNDMEITVKVDGEEVKEKGRIFCEATFIS